MGECVVALELVRHFQFDCFKEFLWLAACLGVVSNRCHELIQIVSVAVDFVGRDDGWHWDAQFFEFSASAGIVQVKAEVLAVHRIETAVGELVYFFTLAKKGSLSEIVGGDDCFV